MKYKKLFVSTIFCLSLLSLVSCNNEENDNNNKENTWTLTSPNKEVSVSVNLNDNGEVHYNVTKNNEVVLNDSLLGFETDVATLNKGLSFIKRNDDHLEFSYHAISGKESEVYSNSNEMTLTFRERNYYLDVTFRAYEDGYAFRYKIYNEKNNEEVVIIEDESTEFNLPSKVATYSMPYVSSTSNGDTFSYEDFYAYKRSDKLKDLKLSMPMLYNVKDDMYSLISEADIYGKNYIGSFLEDVNGEGILKTIPAPAGGKDTTYDVNLPFTSPWRVGITGTYKEIIESNLIEEVYGDVDYYKPDNFNELSKEEQEIYNYEWVDPDVSAWNWLVETSIGGKGQNDLELQKQYVDLASEMGWGWTTLDGGWDTALSDTTNIKEFVKYANSKGVKVMVWCHALNQFDTKAKRISNLNLYQDIGIEGIKIDFFDGQQKTTNATFQMEDQQTLELYEDIYKLCAERKMVVNCHGSNKPTGERRIYPNVINREAIRGNEFITVNTSQTVMLPFIRGVVGPSDFTPVSKPLRSGITIGHQMALAVLLESGSPSMADYDFNYLDQPTSEFYKALSASWDETNFIDGDILSHCIISRRKGNDYFVGGNTIDEMNITLSLDFIKEGTYEAYVYTDTDDATIINKEIKNVTNTDSLSLLMKDNGGFAIYLKKLN